MSEAAITFVPTWAGQNADLHPRVRDFWARHHLLPARVDPAERLAQLCAVAIVDDEIAGVSTAAPARLEFLRRNFAVYRSSVAPDRRLGHVARWLTVYSRDLLQTWSAGRPDLDLAGLAAFIESPQLAPKAREPLWPHTRLNLVAYTGEGVQIRVAWFDHARVAPAISSD